MKCVDVAIGELQFVEFWNYYFKIFNENFGKQEKLTKLMVKVLKYVAMADDSYILSDFVIDHRECFKRIIVELANRNPFLLSSDTFLMLGDFVYDNQYVAQLFYELNLFSLLLDFLAENVIDPHLSIFVLKSFFRFADQQLIQQFVASNPEMISLFFSLVKDPDLSKDDCLDLLNIIKLSVSVNFGPEESIGLIQSNSDYLDSLDYAQQRLGIKIYNQPDLDHFIGAVFQQSNRF